MLKGRVKLAGEVQHADPHAETIAELIGTQRAQARQMQDLKSAVEQLKVAPAPTAPVSAPTKAVVRVPRQRVFTIERDGAGLLTRIIANRMTFTVQRNADGFLTEIIVDAK